MAAASDDGSSGTVVVRGRVEIDTRPPFRSVREAVMLFGEKVLVGEIYAHQLKEMRAKAMESGQEHSKITALTAELEETKQNLQKAKEEYNIMQQSIKQVNEELQHARKELRRLKATDQPSQNIDVEREIEDIKFIENPVKPNVKLSIEEKEGEDDETRKRRYVRFASPPSLARVIVRREDQQPSPSKLVSKKKPLIPIISWLFSKKKTK